MRFRSACIAAARPPRFDPASPRAAVPAPRARVAHPVCAHSSSSASNGGAVCRPDRRRKEAWKNWWNSSCAWPVAVPDRRSAFRHRAFAFPRRRFAFGRRRFAFGRRRFAFGRRRFADPLRLPARGASQSHAAAAQLAAAVLPDWADGRATADARLPAGCLRAERLWHSSTIKLNDYARFVQENREGHWANCPKNRGVNSYAAGLITADLEAALPEKLRSRLQNIRDTE